MALVLADRVKQSTTTTGVSDFVLSGSLTGFQTFAAGVGANNTTYYSVADGADFEIGLGTLSGDGLTLARTTVLQSSNADAKVSFAAGTKEVFVTYPADKAVLSDSTQTLTNKTLTSPILTTPTLGVATATSLQVQAAEGAFTGVQVGTGSTNNIGWVLGNASSGLAGIWSTGVTPSTTNYSIRSDAGLNLYLNASDNVISRIGNVGVTNVAITGLAVTGTLSATGNLTISGNGPNAIGGSTSVNRQFLIQGAFNASTNAYGLAISSSLTPSAGSEAALFTTEGTLNKASSGTHADFASALLLPPTIGAGAATLTNASTLKITGAPSAGTNNYALWVAGGNVRLDGTISVGAVQAVAAKAYGYGGGYGAIQIGTPATVSGNVALAVDVSTVAGSAFTGSSQVILPNNGTLFVNAAGTNFIGAIARNSSNYILLGPSLTGGITSGDVVIDTLGNVGIGQSSIPSYTRLAITGTAGAQTEAKQQVNIIAPTTTAGEGAGLRFNAASGAKESVGIIGVVNNASGNLGSMTFHVYNGGGDIPEWMRITNTGNVGIGASNAAYKLEVVSAASTPASASFRTSGFADDNVSTVFLQDDTANATGVGGRIAFRGLNDVGSYTSFATIQGAKENSTTGNNAGAMIFKTQPNGGTLTERVRISSDGTFRVKGAGTAGSTDAVQFAGSAPASALSLDSSGNLILGSANPNFQGSSSTGSATLINNSGGAFVRVYGGSHATKANFTEFINGSSTSTFDSAGNLGLGVTPSASGGGYKAFEVNAGSVSATTGAGNVILSNNSYYNGTNYIYKATGVASDYVQTGGQHWFRTAASGTAGNPISFTQAMTLDASGALLIGVTSASTTLFQEIKYTTAAAGTRYINTSSSSSVVMDFVAASSQVGSITTSGSATAYNTSSDYRLKNTIAPMTGALAKVALLKPCTYKWNADGSDGEGFIAHELAEICPYAVVGEKDAVDANGKIKPQSIDTSFLVATLTSALQELNAKFEAYVASHP